VKKISLEERVKVKLTESGRRVFMRYWEKAAPDVKAKIAESYLQERTDELGYTSFKMRELMVVFGQQFQIQEVGLPLEVNMFEDGLLYFDDGE